MPTRFEIYETYQRGPAAVLRLFEEALGTRAIYGPPSPDMQQRTRDSLSDEIGRLKRQVSRLKRELGEARGEADRLRRRNAELEALVSKDSHNSSRPPAMDPPWSKRTGSLRRPSGRRPGGQPGHAGHTLRLTKKPTRVIRHRPAQCPHCLSPLREGWSAVPSGGRSSTLCLLGCGSRSTAQRSCAARLAGAGPRRSSPTA